MFSFGVTDLQAAKKAPTSPCSFAIDEDAQKRNTDCIYFLASPLTCKKGDKCEYRHSEAARTNPRDCRFWKSGNCLNAYCSFRHLPLEGKPASASVTSSAMALTKVSSVLATSPIAGAGPSKSKTPCYFFAQGYCAKHDQCPYMHGLPAASTTAGAAAQQNHVGVDGKALHANVKPANGRPLILLKQSGLLPQEIRPVINGRPEALNEVQSTASRAPGLPKQGVPYGLEKATQPERFANPGNLSNRSKYGQNNKKILQSEDKLQGLVQAGELKDQNSYQSEILRKVGSLGGGSFQSFGREVEGYYLPSDSKESLKGLSPSPLHSGQDLDEVDLRARAQLAKRMKINNNLNSSSRGNAGLPDFATQCCRGERLSDHHLKHGKQERGTAIREVAEEAEAGRVKGEQSNKRQSSEAPKNEQSRSFAAKQGTIDHPKVRNVEAAVIPDRGVCASSGLRCKRLTSGTEKEPLAFMGPKSLAQIKAEKLAGGDTGFKAIGKPDLSGTTVAAKPKLLGRMSAMSAESSNVSAAEEKVGSSHTKFVSTTKQDDTLKREIVTAEEFEGPKSLSTLLKRKRDAEFGDTVKKSLLGISKEKISEPNSPGETEDGEFRSNGDSSNVEDTDAAVSSQEDVVDMSAYTKEEIMQVSQGSPVEEAKCETESSDNLSIADLDMEETNYLGEDYEMDGYDNDDDDEDDFAKKLGRVFGLSYE